MKRRFTAWFMAASMALSLTACGGGADSAQDSAADKTSAQSGAEEASEQKGTGEPVTIKFANYALLEQGYEEFWSGVKAGFEEKYPNITVEYVTAPYGEMVNQVINMAGGGDKVDMVFGEIDWVPTLENAGLTVPVTDVLDEEYLADFYPSVMESFKIDGAPYGLPMYISPFVLYYNKDLFEQAGLDPNTPPKTYDEMLSYAEKLSKLTDANGNKVYAFGQTTASVAVSGAALNAMVFNFGGNLLSEDGALSIDNDGFKEAIQMVKELDEKGYNPQNAKLKDLRNLFALGQLAMYYDQSWGFNGVTSINPDAKNFTASAAPLSGGAGSGQSLLQAQCLMYADNGDANREACKLFTEYLMTPEVLNNYVKNITPAYPAKKSMESADNLNPVLMGAADSASNVKAQVFVPTIGDLNLELCTLAQAVTVSGTDVDTAIADFQKAAEAILAE